MNSNPHHSGEQPAQTNHTNKPPIYKDKDGAFVVDDPAEALVVSRKPLIERLLSPESIQRLMLVGGGLLVAGFLVWLRVWTVLQEPLIAAAAIGLVIASIIGSGIALIRFTRYQMAGTGLAFLGALAMPLQLWFYDAQGLITMDQGGHLWIPAALFCAVYAAIARVTRNPLFIYTLVGGVVMTGMLFLADQSVNQFWNIIPQVTFLASVGWISIFSSLLFAEEKTNGDQPSPFARQRYGKALIAAGLTSLTAGLGLLLVGQVGTLTGILSSPWMQWQMDAPDKLWALAVVAGSAVGFVSMYGFLGKQRRYLLVGGLMGIWSVLTLINLLNIVLTGGLAAIVLSIVIIGVNIATMLTKVKNEPTTDKLPASDFVLSDLALIGSLMVSCFALFQFFDLHLVEIPFIPQMSPLWMTIEYLLAATAAATTCLSRISIEKKLTPAASFMSIVSGAVAALAVWNVLSLMAFSAPAMVLVGLLIPMALLIAVAFSNVAMLKQPFQNGASAMTGVHLVCVGGALLLEFSGFESGLLKGTSSFWMLTMMLAAVNYFLSGYNRLVSDKAPVSFNIFMSAACSSIAISIGLSMTGLSTGLAIVMAPVVVGVGLLMAGMLFHVPTGGQGRCLIAGGNVMMLFYCLGQTLAMSTGWILVTATLIHLAAAALTALNSKSGWKTVFGLLSVLLMLASGVLINDLLSFDEYLKAELLAVLAGLVYLAYGLYGWGLESGAKVERKAKVSASLWLGSLLLMVPTMTMLFHYRFSAVAADAILLYGHEMSVIVIAMLLCGVGVMCQLRSATLVGGAGLSIYLLSLLTMIQFPAMLQNAAVLMMIGGGLFFGVGLLLSIYRDYVISIPNRAKEGKGLFQILKWR